MAGDIGLHEGVVISHPGEGDTAHAALTDAGAHVIHRYGDRVHIAEGLHDDHSTLAGVQHATYEAHEIPRETVEELSETERLGLMALALRQSPEFAVESLGRPGEGDSWTTQVCGVLESSPPARRRPTSSYLKGSVAVGLVIVAGTRPELQFSASERTQIVARVQNGLSFFPSQDPSAEITYSYDYQEVTLSGPGDRIYPESYWRDPTMGLLGFSASRAGIDEYVESIRDNFGTDWTYCAFVTKYPLPYSAYTNAIGGPYCAFDFRSRDLPISKLDRVFAHETGHIFGCPDEYRAVPPVCDCGGRFGRWDKPNLNCNECAPGGGVPCLMSGNVWAFCPYTPGHLGWSVPAPIDPCDGIRNEISDLANEITELQSQLMTATPTQKSAIAAKIRAAQAKLAPARQRLFDCMVTSSGANEQ